MGASYGGIGSVYGGGGSQPEPPSGDGTRGFDVMPRQTPIALGNFGPKSGPGNNPGWGDGGVDTTDPNNPFWAGPRTPPPPSTGYPKPPAPGWGDIPHDGGGERPMAPPTTGYAPVPLPIPTPPTGPVASPGIPQPMPPTTGPSVGPINDPGYPEPTTLYPPPPTGPVASPGIPQPMPPTTGPGVGPINDPGDPTPPGTGGSSGGNVTGPRPSLRPMPQPKMPRRTDVSFYRPPQTLQPQPAKDPTGGGLDPRRRAPIYVRPKFQ